ncbi:MULTISPECIES: HAD family phosphatase [Schaedlerella]|jgi:HAD superfamily hydrolase (TIGR01509 family)|uniref:HAD family phosphatase n=1 Tax=Schaedlerella arabinosiphila TaxID=2044587 RepID=A0A9X5CA08_9FIRM|nr:HAD family phosphatase [Schaedlerella arabinosiphila]MCI8767196.1 HAD family phosphatase [Ruminococcus sp.]NBI99693.1 HAD family phosphatase [Lachnospiraceae bacterium]KAI4444328.1 Phosphorylated carbohydrates phosphatase [Schaedlerella arabinosiphila]MCI9330249.1 HAD family phosphatase [Ruminococcus sp.]NDO70784.1 HAD family phosphatase [Schaedlerella arabinosiphila]
MIKGAIFDVDGTLLNSMPVWENLGELYLKSVGVEAEPGLGEELSAMSLPQGADYLIQHYHLGKTRNKVLDGINQQVRDFYAQKVPLKPGVRDFLEGLREYRIPMVIVTSSDRGNVEAALKRLGVMNFFDGMLTCTEMGTDKNRPDIYLAASLQLDTEPWETLVFEDAYHAVLTAKKYGFRTVAVYDEANDGKLGKIWNTADIYLSEYADFDLFWRRVSKL